MLLNAVDVLFFLQIVVIVYGSQQKFMIRNKKTGFVLDASKNPIEIKPWYKKGSQLWTLEWTGSNGRFFVHNVGSGRVLDASPENKDVLTWGKHGGTNQQWNLLPNEDHTRFEVLYWPNHFMVQKDGKVQLNSSKQADHSDEWLLVVVLK